MVPPGEPIFGPFILSDVLKLCKLLCAQNVKLEATLTQTAWNLELYFCARVLIFWIRVVLFLLSCSVVFEFVFCYFWACVLLFLRRTNVKCLQKKCDFFSRQM